MAEPEVLRDASDDGASDDTQLSYDVEAAQWIDLPFTLGRYVATERLARGGAGAVFRAHDPELARDVAIKVVRSRSRSDRVRARLLGEAQAIAKLSHPNVVAVHDVGELPASDHGSPGVYMVMELLEGVTLRQWLRKRERSLADVLDVMLAAGRGLEAAHRAGLVHRDFKPDNLIIGEEPDGDLRVHVVDFGLALAAASTPSTEDPAASSSEGGIEIAGTPGYMAPEQHVGEPTDRRTDLYAFCVTLWEAVHGKQPFRGRTLEDIAQAKRDGPPSPPTRRAPLWLDELLARGLAADPARRPSSMTELLAVIRSRRHLRRNLAIGGLALVLGAGAFGLAWSRGADARECIEQGEERLATIWNDDVQQRTAARFDAAGLPYASDAWARAKSVLDQRVAEWKGARKQSCEGALEGGASAVEQSAASLGCLDAYLDELGARVELLAVADRDIVLRAARMAERMTPPERCLDATWVAQEKSGSSGGAELEAELMQARLQHELGHYDEAAKQARAVVDAAEAAGDHRRQARALLLLCRAEGATRKAGDAPASCTDAWVVGERAGSSTAVISALLELLRRNHRAEDQAEAALYERLVRARMDALGLADTEPGLASELALLVSQREREMGRWQAAQSEAQRAYDLMVEHRGADDPAVVPALNELALDAEELGEIDRSRALFEQATAIMIEGRGRNHPDVLSLENNLAGLEITLGRHEDALRRLEQVRAAKQALEGPRTAWQLTTMYQQVEALVALDRGPEALALAQEELALTEEVHGKDSSDMHSALMSYAWALRANGRCAEVFPVLARHEAIAARNAERDPSMDAAVELERARCLAVGDRPSDAGPVFASALVRFEKLYGARSRQVAKVLLDQARWAAAHGSATQAVAVLERAREICRTSEGDPALPRAIDDELARQARDHG